MNREPITLRKLLMRARLQDQKVCQCQWTDGVIIRI